MEMENLGKRNIVTEELVVVDVDDLLNFSLPREEDEDESTSTSKIFSSTPTLTTHPDDICGSSSLPPDFFEEEEELEWISDKNAFPSVDSCFDILSSNPDIELDHQSPTSVLENSTSSSNGHSHGVGSLIMSCGHNFQVPTRFPRSKIRRKRRTEGFDNLLNPHLLWSNTMNVIHNKQQELALSPLPTTKTNSSSSCPSIGRRCLHCGANKTPQWRVGPMGPKTLCNACGVRYKSGRLVPEYRPANSPSFSPETHSNLHRKIIKMREEKQQYQPGFAGINGNDTCGYRIG